MIRVCSTHMGEVHIGFCWGRPKGKSHLEDLDGDERMILDSIFKKMGSGA